MNIRRLKLCTPVAFVLALLVTIPASGQQVGHYLQGFGGLMSGSAAPPGYYIAAGSYNYFVDSIKGPNGGSVSAHLTVTGYLAPLISGVVKTNFLGADYAFAVAPTISKQRLSSNILPSGGAGNYGMSDSFFMPLELGWHKSKADILFNYAFYIPTGDYSSDQFFNTGLGMWTHQFQLGTTYFLDKTKKWNASLLSTWEIHTKKAGTNITPGPGMTLEYSFGRRMFHYLVNVGVAGSYYRKLALDSGTFIAFHDQENSIGPELDIIAPKPHLSFTFRYEPQFEVRGRTSGPILMVVVTYLGIDHH
jgi:hypothetical protein